MSDDPAQAPPAAKSASAKKLRSSHQLSAQAVFVQKVFLLLAVQFLSLWLLSFLFAALAAGTSWSFLKLSSLAGLGFSLWISENRNSPLLSDNRVLAYYTVFEAFIISYGSLYYKSIQQVQFLAMLSVYFFAGISLYTYQTKVKFVGTLPHLFGIAIILILTMLFEHSGLAAIVYGMYLSAHTVISMLEKLAQPSLPENPNVAVVDWDITQMRKLALLLRATHSMLSDGHGRALLGSRLLSSSVVSADPSRPQQTVPEAPRSAAVPPIQAFPEYTPIFIRPADAPPQYQLPEGTKLHPLLREKLPKQKKDKKKQKLNNDAARRPIQERLDEIMAYASDFPDRKPSMHPYPAAAIAYFSREIAQQRGKYRAFAAAMKSGLPREKSDAQRANFIFERVLAEWNGLDDRVQKVFFFRARLGFQEYRKQYRQFMLDFVEAVTLPKIKIMKTVHGKIQLELTSTGKKPLQRLFYEPLHEREVFAVDFFETVLPHDPSLQFSKVEPFSKHMHSIMSEKEKKVSQIELKFTDALSFLSSFTLTSTKSF
ncbi:hypothetical protein HDU82_005690 [Entophlyctis luteolus]|nr:hypothetical protein HDU82_005690 [Entophlyctis luteolus]